MEEAPTSQYWFLRSASTHLMSSAASISSVAPRNMYLCTCGGRRLGARRGERGGRGEAGGRDGAAGGGGGAAHEAEFFGCFERKKENCGWSAGVPTPSIRRRSMSNASATALLPRARFAAASFAAAAASAPSASRSRARARSMGPTRSRMRSFMMVSKSGTKPAGSFSIGYDMPTTPEKGKRSSIGSTSVARPIGWSGTRRSPIEIVSRYDGPPVAPVPYWISNGRARSRHVDERCGSNLRRLAQCVQSRW